MKITRLRTAVVNIPFKAPITPGASAIKSAGCVLVFLETDQGLTGEGLVSSLNAHRIGVIEAMVRSFEPLIVGVDPQMAGAFSMHAGAEARAFGPKGVSIIGLAAIENALFDLRAKALGVNVSRMLGACRTRMPVYNSGELWVTLSLDELQTAAVAHVESGFKAMKMRLAGDIRTDVERVRVVREAIGQNIGLMVDLNQRMDVASAIRLGRLLECHDLDWIEEPVACHNHRGEAAVAAALDTPIASGESIYTSRGAFEMLQAGAVDVLMPDLQRMGGPGEFLKAAALAEAFDIPVSGHLFPEMSLSLMSAIPNASVVEYMPWVSPIYAEAIELDSDGLAIVPDRPGWGYSFDPAAIERFRM